MASGRWSPTPEQLMILEEMYRTGLRTPSTAQIKQITAHLSSYGKIEGKNVFYWFQNHKARDRQKLRRKLAKQHQLFQQQHLKFNCGLCNGYLDHHHSLGFWPIGYYNPTPAPSYFMNYPPQAGTNGGGWPRMLAMNYNSQKREMVGGNCRHQKAAMDKNMYNGSRIMMVDMNSPDLCASRPLITLELFPTTSTNP